MSKAHLNQFTPDCLGIFFNACWFPNTAWLRRCHFPQILRDLQETSKEDFSRNSWVVFTGNQQSEETPD